MKEHLDVKKDVKDELDEEERGKLSPRNHQRSTDPSSRDSERHKPATASQSSTTLTDVKFFITLALPVLPA